MGGIAHNDGDIGHRQYRCVVNAVTDHHHQRTLLLQCLYPLQLVGGCHIRIYLINAGFTGQLLCRRLVVTTHQQHLLAGILQCLDDGGCLRPKGVVQQKLCMQLACVSQQHPGAAVAVSRKMVTGYVRVCGNEFRVTNKPLLLIDAGTDAGTGKVFIVAGGDGFATGGGRDNGLAGGVF